MMNPDDLIGEIVIGSEKFSNATEITFSSGAKLILYNEKEIGQEVFDGSYFTLWQSELNFVAKIEETKAAEDPSINSRLQQVELEKRMAWDIDAATGDWLDMHGNKVNLKRNGESDLVFRERIRIEMNK